MSEKKQADVGRRLTHASVFALSIYIAGAGLTSIGQLVIARIVGSTSYGIYAYVLAWATVLGYVATLGFNVSLLRFVPSYTAIGRFDLARGVIRFSLRRSLAVASVAAVVGAIFVQYFAPGLEPELRTCMVLGMITIPIISAYAIGASLVRTFGGVALALLPERVMRDGLLIIGLAILVFVGGTTANAPEVMSIFVVSSLATVVVVFVTALVLWPASLRHVIPAKEERVWWSATIPIMLITGLDVFMSRTGVMVLGWTHHIRDAGIFALSLNVAMLVSLSRVAVSTMFSPTAASMHARDDSAALQTLFARATVLCFAGAVAVAIPLLLITKPLLGWFGEDFAAGTPIARILISTFVLAAVFGPQQNLLVMTGHEWSAALSMAVAAVFSVVGCAVGIALNGIDGAAYGFLIAMAVWNVAMAVVLYRRLHILPGLLFALMSTWSSATGRLAKSGGAG